MLWTTMGCCEPISQVPIRTERVGFLLTGIFQTNWVIRFLETRQNMNVTSTRTRILQILNHLQPLSIDEIADVANCSTAQASRELEWLIVHGLPMKRKGSVFTLNRTIGLLDPDQIQRDVSMHNPGLSENVIVLEETESTNEYLLRKLSEFKQPATVCIAEHMSAGRGRRGRTWHGGAYQNIMLSIAWNFGEGRRYFPGLSLAVAVMVCKCLHEYADSVFQVKWPNDILWNNKKISGILVEVQHSTAVVGIGVNCALNQEQVASIQKPVAILEEISSKPVDRSELAALLTIHLDQGLKMYSKSGFEVFRNQWIELHAQQNQLVRTDGVTPIEGIAIGVDIDGALCLRTVSGEIHTVSSGEISILTDT